MTKKTIEKQYTKLSEIDHCLLRPGRYLGAITPHKDTIWIPDDSFKMSLHEITYNPAFLKIFDEIITNSVDHSKRPEGAHLDTIKVNVTDSTISIFDNGGIPVIIHPQYNQWIPEMIFELRSGSNFDDSEESTKAGQNGEGLGICCIFTTKFLAETCDGENYFQMTFTDNSKTKSPPKVMKKKADGFTKFTYTPDLPRFGMGQKIDDDNIKMLFSRTVEIAATNPNLKVYWNGKRIDIKSFKDYISLFQDEYVYDENQFFKIGITKSNEGFQHTSFVNTTRTKIGGNHINYVSNQIIDGVRTYIKKKTKIDVKPADIKNHFHLFIDAKIVNPRYSSQTKDELITEVSNFGASWSMPDKFLNKVLKSEIIKSILDWVQVKEQAQINSELRKSNKELAKVNPKHVPKFSDANEKVNRDKCEIFICEGDSARLSIQSARGNNSLIGSFALKGKPLNVFEEDNKKIVGNEELVNLMTATGLRIGESAVLPDGEWVYVEIDGVEVLVNENDKILYKNKEVLVKSLF